MRRWTRRRQAVVCNDHAKRCRLSVLRYASLLLRRHNHFLNSMSLISLLFSEVFYSRGDTTVSVVPRLNTYKMHTTVT